MNGYEKQLFDNTGQDYINAYHRIKDVYIHDNKIEVYVYVYKDKAARLSDKMPVSSKVFILQDMTLMPKDKAIILYEVLYIWLKNQTEYDGAIDV